MTIRVGIMPIRIEISDFHPPTKEELEAFLNVAGPGKTLVHCLSQKDRTGMACAFYRIKAQGWPVEKAIDEMHAMGMHWWYKNAWTKALKEYCK